MSTINIAGMPAPVDPQPANPAGFFMCLPLEVNRFELNSVEDVRVSFAMFRGNLVLDIRRWEATPDGMRRATPRGITMGAWHAERLAEALAAAAQIARENGLLQKGGAR